MIKVTPADKWFSQCVKKRARWACERCSTVYGGPSRALHCSHLHGRGKWSTRFDPRNAASLCYGCHRIMGSQPEQHRAMFLARLGQYQYDALTERLNDLSIGKLVKREQKQVAAHFKATYEQMGEGDSFGGWV